MQSAFARRDRLPLSSANTAHRKVAVAAQSTPSFNELRGASPVLSCVEVGPRLPAVLGVHVRHEHLRQITLVQHERSPRESFHRVQRDHCSHARIDASVKSPLAPGHLIPVDREVGTVWLCEHSGFARIAQPRQPQPRYSCLRQRQSAPHRSRSHSRLHVFADPAARTSVRSASRRDSSSYLRVEAAHLHEAFSFMRRIRVVARCKRAQNTFVKSVTPRFANPALNSAFDNTSWPPRSPKA